MKGDERTRTQEGPDIERGTEVEHTDTTRAYDGRTDEKSDVRVVR